MKHLACIVVCAGLVLGCVALGKHRSSAVQIPVTSTYAGRLERGPVYMVAAAPMTLPAPEVPEPEDPHWSELLDPLRQFTDKDWRRIRRVQKVVHRAAATEGLSPSLINGMIWVESKFFPRIRGSRGPRGLMQLMPVTARSLAERLDRPYMPNDADFNVSVGVYYLARLLHRFEGDLHLALAAYNWGPAPILAWLEEGAGTPKPRMPYVSRVYRAAHAFCERLAEPGKEPRDGPYVCPQLAPAATPAEAVDTQLTSQDQVEEPRVIVAEQDV